jgi:hypothetical protein
VEQFSIEKPVTVQGMSSSGDSSTYPNFAAHFSSVGALINIVSINVMFQFFVFIHRSAEFGDVWSFCCLIFIVFMQTKTVLSVFRDRCELFAVGRGLSVHDAGRHRPGLRASSL